MSDSDENSTENNKMEIDSSDSDSSDNENELLEKRASELESQLKNNPYEYDSYIELVSIYKKSMDLTAMRNTHKSFHEHYPLTPALWLDWIRNEMRVANTETERNYVTELFRKAVEDYLSIDLWMEYCQFTIGSNDPVQIRSVFEQALNQGGLHIANGTLLWDAYREYELALLSLITDNTSDEWKEQVAKVLDLFKRQLSVPLLNMDRTYVEWRVFTERLSNPDLIINKEQIDWAYRKATRHLSEYDKDEQDLSEAKNDKVKLECYRTYIAAETKPEHIRCLYERAISDLCLEPDLWYDYCMYYYDLGNHESALLTVKRALRNCPWNEELWVLQIRILEVSNQTHDDITKCLESALQTGFQTGTQYLQLWLAYLEHFRRFTKPKDEHSTEKLREAFRRAYQHLTDNFGDDADPECSLLRFWAQVEAGYIKDVSQARNVWNDYGIVRALGNAANAWLELISIEKQYGDEKHVRKLYHKALTNTKDWPQYIVQSWLAYEREFGTIDTVISSADICKKFMKHYNLEHPIQLESQPKSKPKSEPTQAIGKKRKFQERIEIDAKPKEIKLTPEQEHIEINSEKQERSVFISNLDYSVTDEQLKAFLVSSEELRLVKDRRGHSKGYAYCVFATKSEAEKTLARDRELLNDRPVFISKCNPDKMQREPQFKYATTQEKHKLFVKGLPMSLTQEEVEDLFKPYGELRHVRLVTYRNGRSKGLAYVEFVNEQDAKKAIIATDNTVIKDFTISVAISDPPKRKLPENLTSTVEVTRHSKSRLQIPFVPRSVQNVEMKKLALEEKQTMTNADFRKMFDKK